ncbi:MAG: PorT family protein [Paludibacteraceae bacterium]|nr:PorT family protein [Paludibacteraceae bacterium]
MQRHHLLTGILLLVAGAMCAQPRLLRPEFYLGIHGGVSASSVMFTPSVDNMTPITQACVLGGNGGLVFRYAGHKYCALQVELNYQHRGWREHVSADADAGIAEDNYRRELHYIELPFMMNLNVGSETCRWFFNLGPQIGYCVYDNHGKGTQLSDDKTQYAPIDHAFDWGVVAATGVEFHTRKAGIYQLEVRFDYSLGGIFGTGLTDHFSMASPMDLSINLGWQMPIIRKKKLKIAN